MTQAKTSALPKTITTRPSTRSGGAKNIPAPTSALIRTPAPSDNASPVSTQACSTPTTRTADRPTTKPAVGLSERELSVQMAAAGRFVSQQAISEWRRCGLMPRLSTHSLGRNKGKICFWTGDDVFVRAALIFDLFEAGIERHEVYWLLWLCGFDIALPQLRRAWLHKARAQSEHRGVIPAAPEDLPAVALPNVVKNAYSGIVVGGAISAQSLLEVVLSVNAALNRPRRSEIDALIEALDSPSVELGLMLGTARG